MVNGGEWVKKREPSQAHGFDLSPTQKLIIAASATKHVNNSAKTGSVY